MILTLSSEDVRNTVFTDEHGLPVFKSNTPFRLGVRTTSIRRQTQNNPAAEDPAEVARIDWHCIGSSVFTIEGRTLESNVFLPKKGFFGRQRTFVGPDGHQYRWDTHYRDVSLSYNDDSGIEIARYHRATLGIIGKRKSACLEIAPEAEHMLELIVLTFIYVEKFRREREKMQRRAAAAGGGP